MTFNFSSDLNVSSSPTRLFTINRSEEQAIPPIKGLVGKILNQDEDSFVHRFNRDSFAHRFDQLSLSPAMALQPQVARTGAAASQAIAQEMSPPSPTTKAVPSPESSADSRAPSPVTANLEPVTAKLENEEMFLFDEAEFNK